MDPLSPSLSVLLTPVLLVLGLLAASALSGRILAGQLRSLAFGEAPAEGLDWAGLLGLAGGLWVLLLGSHALAGVAELSLEGVLSSLDRVLAALTLAGAILSGSALYRRRRLAQVRREAREALEAELRPLEYALVGLAALAVSGTSLLGTLLLVFLGGLWAYQQNPDLRGHLEALLRPSAAPQRADEAPSAPET